NHHRDFTGQKENMELGLLYYGARFYVPSIGRFASADTIVPDPTNPQAFSRYSYVLNNPIVLIDPSGHIACNSELIPSEGPCNDDGSWQEQPTQPLDNNNLEEPAQNGIP